ncbi:MAG: M23 family metallopeptidase [Treponema sp.]|nr:M23 family metallopeptidase [Treponema sp.]
MRKVKSGKKRFLLCSLFIVHCSLLFAMEWPVENGIMDKNFGWNDQGQPVLGVSFVAEGQVMAADQGELLFYSGKDNGASRLPSPLGSWIALDHGGGIISIYSRMAEEPGPAPMQITETIETGYVLGEAGISGWSEKKGVYFTLFDRKERRWINPAIIVSSASDSRQPIIQAVRLRNSEGRIIDLTSGQVRTISQGRYTILVETSETFPGTNRNSLSPFRIICSVNGSETGRLNFETYAARDGVLMVYRNGLVPVRQIYALYPAYELGEIGFTRGQAVIEIISQNVQGASRNATYRVAVE